MLHKMKLQESPFERIKNGTKTVEFRLYDEKRKQIKIGDQIEFSKMPELEEKLLVNVIDLYKESSFEDLFSKLYEDKETVQNMTNGMYKYYSPEKERQYGVLGIKISICNNDIELAKRARLNAYAPYSNYLVGAALRTRSGKVYLGCNIENDGIQSICAERTAFAKALSEGEREFESIAVVGGPRGKEPTETCMPCGYCRQFMSEFVGNDFKIYVVGKDNEVETLTMKELLPHSFRLE